MAALMAGRMAGKKEVPEGLHRVERGLYTRKRGGRASWLFIFTIGGRRREVSLGHVDELGITAARSQVAKMRALVEQGIDPVAHRREARKSFAEAPAPVYRFSQLLEDALPVIETAKHWRNPKSRAQWRSSLVTYALPVLGELEVEAITRDDILSVLRPIWEEKTETASRVRMRLEALFSYAIATGKLAEQNPALWKGNLELFLPPAHRVKRVEHFEALPAAEIREMLEQTKWSDPPVGWAAIAFGALTASRANEFTAARWSEIDFDAAVWSCPRRKDGKDYPHRVPLSAQALELLRRLPQDGDYVFPSPQRPGAPLHKYTPRVLIIKRCGAGTMHGFRSSFRDWAAETGVDRVLAEKSLMHATGGAVEQAYQRSDLLEQRRPVMQAWADTILPLAWLK